MIICLKRQKPVFKPELHLVSGLLLTCGEEVMSVFPQTYFLPGTNTITKQLHTLWNESKIGRIPFPITGIMSLTFPNL